MEADRGLFQDLIVNFGAMRNVPFGECGPQVLK